MSDSLRIAATAAAGFDVFHCVECAENIKKQLVSAGLRGHWIELEGRGKKRFMICLSHDGGQATITETGRHVAIRVGDVVFDNLHSNGMLFEEWLQDFDAVGGIALKVVEEF